MRMRTFATLMLIPLSCVATVSALELGFRALRVIMNKPSPFRADPLLGWAPKESFTITGMVGRTSRNAAYRIDYSTDAEGLRYTATDWARNAADTAAVVLVIGDSYTGGPYASDTLSWFAHLNARLGLAVHAYGIGGAGTFQEYLVLERLQRRIKPDIVILQFCSNDPENDDWDVRFSAPVRSQALRRPYWRPPSLEPVYAEGLGASLYRFAENHSQFFAYVDNQVSRWQDARLAMRLATSGGVDSVAVRRARRHSERLLDLFASRARAENRAVRLFSINCTTADADYRDWWIQAARKAGIEPLPGPSQAVEAAEARGEDVSVSDGAHWNERGNSIVGARLADELSILLSRPPLLTR